MQEDNCFQLGYIIKTHGLKGEISVMLDVDDPNSYRDLDVVFVKIKDQLIPFTIETIRISSKRAIVKFEAIDHVESARQLKGATLYLPLDLLPDLEACQFYYHEVIGFTIEDEKKGILGKVESFYASHQNLLSMKYNGTEVLIPVHDHIIKKVDKQRQVILVSLPEGLLEINQ